MLVDLRFSNFRIYFYTMQGRISLLSLILLVFTGLDVKSQTYINEIMASNQVAAFDDFFESDDWVEIYHEGGVLNLAGYYLSDREDNLTKWQFPNTNPGITTITPGGHMVVWLDNDEEQGEDHANFKLSPDGEGIYLTAQDGVTIIDFIVFPPQQTDVSYGRECDGCDSWMYFDIHTIDDDNAYTTPTTPLLYINEILIDNEMNLVDESFDTDSWLEVYNPNTFQVNLSSYTLSNSEGLTYTLPSDAPYDLTVEAEGFLLLWLDGEPSEGGHHMGFTPSSTATDITLTGPDGVEAASYNYQSGTVDVSWGRQVDGSPESQWFNTPTPRVTNSLFVIPPGSIVINELQSANLLDTTDFTGATEDWFEIMNTGTVPVDLGGYYVTDRLNQPTKYQFPLGVPDSTTLAPGEFVLIFADEDNSEGWNHTNFKFNSDGEALVLRSIDGFTIADSVHFGAIPIDYSWGRDPDGYGDWREFIVGTTTPEYCNVCTSRVSIVTLNPLIVYPNPVSRGEFISINKMSEVFEITGRKVAKLQPGLFKIMNFDPGTYVVRSKSGETLKLVIE